MAALIPGTQGKARTANQKTRNARIKASAAKPKARQSSNSARRVRLG